MSRRYGDTSELVGARHGYKATCHHTVQLRARCWVGPSEGLMAYGPWPVDTAMPLYEIAL